MAGNPYVINGSNVYLGGVPVVSANFLLFSNTGIQLSSTAPTTNQFLKYDGTNIVGAAVATGSSSIFNQKSTDTGAMSAQTVTLPFYVGNGANKIAINGSSTLTPSTTRQYISASLAWDAINSNASEFGLDDAVTATTIVAADSTQNRLVFRFNNHASTVAAGTATDVAATFTSAGAGAPNLMIAFTTTRVDFYITGQAVATSTTNLPTAAMHPTIAIDDSGATFGCIGLIYG